MYSRQSVLLASNGNPFLLKASDTTCAEALVLYIRRDNGPPAGRGNGVARGGGPPGATPVQMPLPPRLAPTPAAQQALPGPPPMQAARGPMEPQEEFPQDDRNGDPGQQQASFPGGTGGYYN